MSKNWHPARFSAILTLLLFVTLVPACQDDGPALPEPAGDVPSQGGAARADATIENFGAALESRDVAAMAAVLDPSFEMVIDPTYAALAGLENDRLSRNEFLAAFARLSGAEAVEGGGASRDAVAELTVVTLEAIGSGWVPVASEEAEREIVERACDLALRIAFTDESELNLAGAISLRAACDQHGRDGQPTTATWRLVELADATFPRDGAVDAPSLGALWRHYLGNQAPKAVVDPAAVQILVEQSFVLSAAASADPEDALASEPFRWRFTAEGEWTAWTFEPEVAVSYATAGEHTVTLEVRDAEGLVAAAEAAVAAYRYHEPTHPDSVAANYRDNYEDRFVAACDGLLHDDFIFVKTDGEIWNRDQELVITENLFTGQPGQDFEGNPVAPVESIEMALFPQDTWEAIDPDHPRFGGYAGQRRAYQAMIAFHRPTHVTFLVQGMIVLYVAEVEANGRTEYRVLGFEDFTGDGPGPNEEVSWSAVKGLYQ